MPVKRAKGGKKCKSTMTEEGVFSLDGGGALGEKKRCDSEGGTQGASAGICHAKEMTVRRGS